MKFVTKLIVFIALSIVAISAINTYGPEKEYDFKATDYSVMASSVTITPKPMEVEIVRWEKYPVAKAKLKLYNPDEIPVIDPVIKCIYHGASKTPITSTRVKVYIKVPTGKTVTTDNLLIGFAPDQAKGLSCEAL